MAAFGGARVSDEITYHYQLVGTPSSNTAVYVSLKDAIAAEAFVTCVNAAANAAPGAVSLRQATAVAGTGSAALPFTSYFVNTDPANTTVWTAANAASNAVTPANTASLISVLRIPIPIDNMDKANNADCVAITLANATNATYSAFLVVRARQGGGATVLPNLRAD